MADHPDDGSQTKLSITTINVGGAVAAPALGSGKAGTAGNTEQPAATATGDSSVHSDSLPFDYRKLWNITEDDFPIMVTKDYSVKLDKEGDLDWETSESFDLRLSEAVDHNDLSEVFNRVALLRSYPVEHLTKRQRDSFLTMVGEGLARAFDFDAQKAMSMLAKAGEYAIARNQEVARGWYLCATGLSTGIFAVILSVGWINRLAASEEFGNSAFYIGLASCAGAMGSFFSILRRVGRSPLDPSAGWQLHWLEGFGRILIGVLGAVVALLSVKVGLALTILSDRGFAGLFLIAFVAGFSERLVHTIIKRVELDATPRNEEGKIMESGAKTGKDS